jgi:hypothetical protein
MCPSLTDCPIQQPYLVQAPGAALLCSFNDPTAVLGIVGARAKTHPQPSSV